MFYVVRTVIEGGVRSDPNRLSAVQFKKLECRFLIQFIVISIIRCAGEEVPLRPSPRIKKVDILGLRTDEGEKKKKGNVYTKLFIVVVVSV